MRRIGWRLMPLLGLVYLIAYVDRQNVSFAKLQMTTDIGLSEAAYGLGASLFFIGYFLFEVPSNLILVRVGVRRWFARIMASWGLALCEYWLAVPANRIGYGTYTGAELKAIQEVVSITIFVGFSVLVLGEKLTINTAVGFGLIGVGAFFIFNGPFK